MATYGMFSEKTGKTYEYEIPEGEEVDVNKLKAMTALHDMQDVPSAPSDGGNTHNVSLFERMRYGAAIGTADWENGMIIWKAKHPEELDKEIYGDDIEIISEDERLARLHKVRKAEIDARFPEVVQAGLQDSGGASFGKFAKLLYTPTTLLPIGHGYKAMSGIGALLSGSWSWLDQRARSTELAPEEVTVAAGVGAIAVPATVFAGRQAKNFIGNVLEKKARTAAKGTEEVAAAGARTEEVQKIIDINYGEGASPYAGKQIEPIEAVKMATGRTVEDIIADQEVSGVRLTVPTKLEQLTFGEVPRAGATSTARESNTFFDKWIGSLSSAVGRIHPELKARIRKVDFLTSVWTLRRQRAVQPFIQFYNKKFTTNEQDRMKGYLLNRDFDSAKTLIHKVGGDDVVKMFDDVTKVHSDIYDDLINKAGYKKLGFLPNYWHRSIRDYDGLVNSLGKKQADGFAKLIQREEAKLRKSGELQPKEKLSQEQREELLGDFLRGRKRKPLAEEKLGAAQKRLLNTISREQLQFYDDPMVSLSRYIDNSTYDVERKAFFGHNAVLKAGSATKVDSDKSAAALTDELYTKGEITRRQVDDLRELIHVRFINGDRAANKYIQGYRALSYFATLTNPFSAIIQLGDVGVSFYAHGIRHTLMGMLTKAKVTMQELGLDKVIAQEFLNEGSFAKSLHTAFTISGFRHVDRFGKNTILNAALRKGTAGAKNLLSGKKLNKSGRILEEKYQKAFGDEYKGLVDDLANGKMSENVKLFLWSELADMQPISLAEMPQKYLDIPNARLVYTLKTYMTKQLDLLKRDVKDKWDKGGTRNRYEAVRNAVAYTMIVPTGNTGISFVKDAALGKEIDIEQVPDKYVEQIFKQYMTSEYVMSKYVSDGRIVTGIAKTLAPPHQHIEDTAIQLANWLQGDDVEIDRVLRHAPLGGQAYYYWVGNGLDNFEDWTRIQGID